MGMPYSSLFPLAKDDSAVQIIFKELTHWSKQNKASIADPL